VTLRARLAITLFVVLVGPALVGAALLAGALPARGGPDLARSAEAIRMAVEARCRGLTATAQALAVSAAARGEPIAVSPTAATGPWVLCDAQPGPPLLPAGNRYAGLAAWAEIHDRSGALSGYAYAVQPLDAEFVRQLSAAAGTQVALLAVGETPDSRYLAIPVPPGSVGPVPMAVAKPSAMPRPQISALLAVTATGALIAGVLSWWLAGIATRPLETLLAAVERVAAGDLTVRSRVDGRDETGRLGRGLDRLISGMQETQRLSVTDPLTGLGNVRHLGDSLRLEAERATRFGRTLGVLVLDLDHFKAVNDGFGHRAGDAVLAEFAVRIRRVIREVDLAFRQGGEEFVILLPETDVTGSLTAARRIGEAVREHPFRVRRRRGVMDAGSVDLLIPVTVSIGVAVMPRHAVTASEVLDAADEALYTAKKAGRNTYVLASACLPEQRLPVDGSLPRADAGGASGGTTSPRTPVGG
jgi:diguanylate cyclase (GGDEF)-like protein